VALRDLLRRAPEPEAAVPAAEPPWPAPPPAEAPLGGAGEWSADPGFATVALEERPAEADGAWTAAAEPIDVTDHTVDMPALAPLPRRGAGRVLRATLTLVLVLGCAGAALAASGALQSKRDPAPPATSALSSSAIATAPRHHAKPKPAKRAHRARHHRRARVHRHHAAVVAPRVAAAAPAATAPVQARSPAPVRHIVSAPAPTPAPVATRPAPKPVATKPATTTVSQPAPSAPSGEPGRQPPPAQ
jgi:hypothetical protein